MTSKRSTTNRTTFIVIALVVIIVAFLLLGGVPWMKGLTHGSGPMETSNWNWTQILISMGIGFVIGLLVGKRN
jgi:hypothetical protein